jgi:putative transcriptional regulator
MRKFREYLAKNIKKIKGVETQAEFARRLGIGQASLNRILNKEQGISLDMLELICHRLKIDLKDLMKP